MGTGADPTGSVGPMERTEAGLEGTVDVDLSGTWRAAPADEALRREATDPSYDDGGWEELRVPGHWRSSPAFADHDGPVLHRHRFAAPDRFGPGATDPAPAADRRSWLVLDGAFYTTDVWLDGTYLGDTEGYFFPHAFEVTEQLASGDEHVLAVEVACLPQHDRAAKRNLTGVFQHWDLIDQDGNPGGLWRPVRLEQSGPVRIRHSRAVCRTADERAAVVALRVVLDATEPTTVTLRTQLAGVADERQQPLAAGENRVEWTVTVPEPALWWPWALGGQPLEDLVVEVVDEQGRVSDRRHRRIGLRRVALRDWVLSVNGERLFVKGANLAPARLALGEAEPELLARDVALARQSGLDMLRVHGHISRPELYEAADEAGVLLWQDLPLQWGYHRSVRRQARRQAREAVDLLGHHPSIYLWCGHNEPMALDIEPDALEDPHRRNRLATRAAAAQLLPTWNKTVLDGSIRRVLEHTDGSRPVVPHSGVLPHPPLLDGTDSHLYFGWYHGEERDLGPTLRRWPRLARFVSEFGAQAVPDDAGFLEPERWPELDWTRARDRHALQRAFFDRHVPPGDFATFEAWQAATQAYQAELLRHHVETLRRLKYRPCGGFAMFCWNDVQPAVTWSVLDHQRRPKAGLAALAHACAPVIVVADRLPAVLRPGDRIDLDVHVVSDARVAHADVVVDAELSWRSRRAAGAAGAEAVAASSGSDRDPGGAHEPGPPGAAPGSLTWRWQGDLPADSCVRVGAVAADLPGTAAGCQLALDLRVSGAGLAWSSRTTADVAAL